MLTTLTDFSIALNRGSFEAENYSTHDPNFGYISFGGIAPVPITNNAVTVPFQAYRARSDLPENGHRDVTYYHYTVDAEFSFMGSKIFIPSNSTSSRYVLSLILPRHHPRLWHHPQLPPNHNRKRIQRGLCSSRCVQQNVRSIRHTLQC